MVPTDPHRLRPGELCRLLNSTPLGEVISDDQLRRHRTRAGLRIGNAKEIDLLKYVGWLFGIRHGKPETDAPNATKAQLEGSAQGAARLGCSRKQPRGHGQKLTSKQEAVIAALLTESTYAAAAAKAGVGESTLYRWLHLRPFRDAYRKARRELVESAIGRIQAASGQAVEALLTVASKGRRDSDRVRASVALLEHAFRGLADADLLHGPPPEEPATPMDADAVVSSLTVQMRQLEHSDVSIPEKSRLTAVLADGLLRALSVSEIETGLKALETAMADQNDEGKPNSEHSPD